jgi:integrase
VRRVKNGTPSTHPLTGREMRELHRHQRESPESPFVFVSERGAPLSAPGFSRMVERAGVVANLGIKVHAHMLRHATGFKLANDGHDTRSSQHSEHDALYGAGSGPVQELLAGLRGSIVGRLSRTVVCCVCNYYPTRYGCADSHRGEAAAPQA